MRRALAACATLVLALIACPLPACVAPQTGEHTATALRYMVSAAHPRAVTAGCRVLADGGSVADAAVAVQMVLALVEPHASGPGGGLIALHHDVDGVVQVYDGLATAPASAGRDIRRAAEEGTLSRCGTDFGRDVTVSARAVGVPGVVTALARLHRDHGRRPWASLFDEAIAAARDGFPMPPYLATLLTEPVFGRPRCAWAGLARRYCDDAGRPLPAGTRIRNIEAARTLQHIRDEGARGYAAAVEAWLARVVPPACGTDTMPLVAPTLITASDLTGDRTRVRAPLCHRAFGLRVCTAPPPSYGGFVVLRVLDWMARAGDADGISPPWQRAHRQLQASHLAQLRRRVLVGDPEFVEVGVAAALTPDVLAGDFARMRRNAPVRFSPPADAAPEQSRTSHVSIVDGTGNALAMTTTLNRSFGAHLEAGGFPLNNALGNFTSPRARAGGRTVNGIAPGKRPRTAIAPTLVFRDGALRLVAGAAGGTAIPDQVARTVMHTLVHDMDPATALAQPNLSGQRVRGRPPRLRTELERGTEAATWRDALERLGYEDVSVGRLRTGAAIVVIGDDGVLRGAADPRRDGVAGGR